MRLMISVVSSTEALEALSGGAEILDIKNPAEGSLGAQPPAVIQEIERLSSGKAEVSAAIGDMPNLPGTAALAALGAASCGVDYIKVGLHGPRNENEALAMLRAVRRAVHGFRTSIIAAAYADFERAGTLNPACLPTIAAQAGVQGCLLDTAIKDGHTLFDFLDPQTLRSLAEQVHDKAMLLALAGALGEKDVRLIQALGADIIGMRSAVCLDNRREGPLEVARILQLHRILVPIV